MKAQPKTQDQSKKTQRTIFQEYTEALVVAVILAILIRGFLVQAFKIPSESMVPTLLKGDHILVNKFIYGFRVPFTNARWPEFSEPERGDVIVFVYPVDRSKDFIKRVVAVGGDTVEILDKQVFINGKPVGESYAHHYDPKVLQDFAGPRDNMVPKKVPKDHLFVMGDNRDHSHDSRFWDFVPVWDVKGCAFMIYYSANYGPAPPGVKVDRSLEWLPLSTYVRWNRMFKIIN